MLLQSLIINALLVAASCMPPTARAANKSKITVNDNDKSPRDKRFLGLLIQNVLQNNAPPRQINAARKTPQNAQPMMPMMMPMAAAPAQPAAPAAPAAPVTAPPVTLPAVFGLKTFEYRPDLSYYTDKNGFINFNPNQNYVVATPIGTGPVPIAPGQPGGPAPAPAPAAPPPAPMAPAAMAPPASMAPPATMAPQPTLKQQQQAAFINFLASLSGFPQMATTTMAPPPATMAPPQPVQPGVILIPQNLLPGQKLLSDKVVYQYSQPYDSSSNLKTNDDYNVDYNGHYEHHPGADYYPHHAGGDVSYSPDHYSQHTGGDLSYSPDHYSPPHTGTDIGLSHNHYHPHPQADESDGSYHYEGPIGSKGTPQHFGQHSHYTPDHNAPAHYDEHTQSQFEAQPYHPRDEATHTHFEHKSRYPYDANAHYEHESQDSNSHYEEPHSQYEAQDPHSHYDHTDQEKDSHYLRHSRPAKRKSRKIKSDNIESKSKSSPQKH